MSGPTKGMVEAALAGAVIRFQREQQGRGPSDARAYLIGDLVMVRCTGVLTQTESHLAATDEGRRLIRSARQELRTIHQLDIEDEVAAIVGCKVLRSYCDISVAAAEQVEIYVLEEDVLRRIPAR